MYAWHVLHIITACVGFVTTTNNVNSANAFVGSTSNSGISRRGEKRFYRNHAEAAQVRGLHTGRIADQCVSSGRFEVVDAIRMRGGSTERDGSLSWRYRGGGERARLPRVQQCAAEQALCLHLKQLNFQSPAEEAEEKSSCRTVGVKGANLLTAGLASDHFCRLKSRDIRGFPWIKRVGACWQSSRKLTKSIVCGSFPREILSQGRGPRGAECGVTFLTNRSRQNGHLVPIQVVEIEPHPIATDTGDNSNSNSNSNQHAAAPDAGTKHHRKRRSARGLLLLSTVPLVWGTYGPSVKYLYDMGGDAVASPPGLVFNFACCLVSAMTLAGVFWINHLWRQWDSRKANDAKVIIPQATAQTNRYAARAGLELGGWLFLGSTMQVWGLELTTASRAAFLVQLTTVIVPLLEALLGRRKLKPQLWIACALATVGVALVSLGGMAVSGTTGLPSIAGVLESVTATDLRAYSLLVLSAVFYSLHVVRLGVHVSRLETLDLARAKAIAEVLYSGAALVAAAVIGGQGSTFSRFASSLVSQPGYLVLFGAVTLWNGAVTAAYAMWAMTRGQAVVAPSEANLVYSTQPLWATLFSVVLLKEAFGPTESAGALVVLAALFLATYDPEKTPSGESIDGAVVKDDAREEEGGNLMT